mmetsp:Transcript_15400/g.20182  ORF Transcript_15400/g.20182 Transcript_15400/m.20182 type:complete len:689 (-) Transcript_15400:573-2639(-)|eukprot:CAMPEP_0117755056 /NCGR_PEP_ID=MMETSP0947-20121206/13215_1 /TAXON_ID=44440 /ORGANISM="Chattonella subsalsa, Strain CCMP2191" /LENGTH=688 /DNA_ID=CAMNT_0005574299 /DNA_START=184 /DNA_END=2250 /DNA_ORIENTATION=+
MQRVLATRSLTLFIVLSVTGAFNFVGNNKALAPHLLTQIQKPSHYRWTPFITKQQNKIAHRLSLQPEDSSETKDVVEQKQTVVVPAEDPSVTKLRIQAEKLRLQAEKMKIEAEKEELILQEEKLKEKEIILAALSKLVAELNPLRDEPLKAEVKTLLEEGKIRDNILLELEELSKKTENESEKAEIDEFSKRLLAAVQAIDENFAKTIGQKITGFKPNVDLNVELSQRELLNQWLKENNITEEEGERFQKAIDEEFFQINDMSFGNGTLSGLIALPSWVPVSLLRYLLTEPTSLPREELEDVKKQIFGADIFYVTGTDQCEFAWLIRGNVRGDANEVFAKVNDALLKNSTLAEKYQLFYVEDPTPLTPEEMSMGMQPNPKPVFIITSKNVRPADLRWGSYAFGFVTFALTALTAYIYGLGTFALNPAFLSALEKGDVSVASQPLPVVAGLLAILAIHEIGHFTAAAKWNLKISPPTLIPSLQIGSFGSITRLLSFPKDRRALFDFAVAGPLAGGLASMGMLAAGLLMTTGASPEALASYPVVPASLFQSSLLAGVISVFTAPTVITAQATSAVPVHPFAIAGLAGLIANALNFMPIGQLDGGRAAIAAFNRRSAALLGFLTLIVQAIVGFTQPYSIQFYWGLIIIFFQRQAEIPAQDEVTPIDQERSLGLFIGFLLTVFTLLPFPELG